MRSFIPAYPDPNITPEEARRRLPLDKVVVGWYSNRRVRQSVTHYHPYHEYIYMASGKAHYYVNGGQYELHPGELMLIPPGWSTPATTTPTTGSSYRSTTPSGGRRCRSWAPWPRAARSPGS